MKYNLIFVFFSPFLFFVIGVFGQMTPTYEVNIPLRDGKFLAADVYVPAGCVSCPTILIQTPYNKNSFRNGLPMGVLQNINSSNYSWVVVDWRGFYSSASAAVAQPNRGQDGYDVMDWIVAQSWAGGRIGTWGPSALGIVQYHTAKEQHPNHTCMVPLVAQPQTAYDGYYYGGVLEKSRLAQLDLLGYGLSPLVLSNPYHNFTWQYMENSTWYPEAIQIPTLQIGGWYDHTIDDMIDWYAATRTFSVVDVRDKQWLLIGPWVHGGTGAAYVGSSIQGELNYPNAAYKSDSMAIEFFEYYLLDTTNDWETTPAVTYYELGKEDWATSSEASIAMANSETLYLQGDNLLGVTSSSGTTSFVSDPRLPSPTLGGATLSIGLDQGPHDQISLSSRSDLISFSTGDLEVAISVSGSIQLDGFISCDQPDADLAVRLVDVYPDGRNILINDGIKRLRFRNGYTLADESFMTTGQVYAVQVDLPFVNYTWKEGHQLKIFISGNHSARWDVNLQNGGAMYATGDTNNATISVYHTAQYPSKLILPTESLLLDLSEDTQSKDQIIVYPNPMLDFFTISPFEGDIKWVISDLKGVKVLSGNSLENSQIDVSFLQKGMYFLRMYNKEGAKNVTFVKE
jgi:uncharacterized protein